MAASKDAFDCASGLNGLPFSMPIDLSWSPRRRRPARYSRRCSSAPARAPATTRSGLSTAKLGLQASKVARGTDLLGFEPVERVAAHRYEGPEQLGGGVLA